jgi:hypothetical protein
MSYLPILASLLILMSPQILSLLILSLLTLAYLLILVC